MFNIGFTVKDFVRAGWTFIFGALSYVLLAQTDIINGSVDWKAVAVGAAAAGLSALKNLVLADGTTVKG